MGRLSDEELLRRHREAMRQRQIRRLRSNQREVIFWACLIGAFLVGVAGWGLWNVLSRMTLGQWLGVLAVAAVVIAMIAFVIIGRKIEDRRERKSP